VFYPNTPIIKIDNNPLHIATPIPTRHAIWADAKPSVEMLLKKTKQRVDDTFLNSSAKVACRHIDELMFDHKVSKDGKLVHPAAIVEKITSALEKDAILVGDTGSTTIWINNIAKLNGKQRFLWSATLASLGGSIGQAIGASFAAPEKQVVLIAGDGGFQMGSQDLVTAAMYGRNIKCFILNNSTYRFIEFEQASHDGNAPAGTKFLNPDYVKLAEACHFKGFRIKNYSEIDSVIKEAMLHDGPVVVDCYVDPNALLIPPAVTPGMAFNFTKSVIKSWFKVSSDDEKRLEAFAAEHKE
jgi:pyruvate dehydrogenase (quinone)